MLPFPVARLVLLLGTNSSQLVAPDAKGGGDMLCDSAKYAGLQAFRVYQHATASTGQRSVLPNGS